MIINFFIRHSESNILADRVISQINTLRYKPNDITEFISQFSDINAINTYAPPLRHQQPQNHIAQSCLTGAGLSDKCNRLPFLYLHVYTVQHRHFSLGVLPYDILYRYTLLECKIFVFVCNNLTIVIQICVLLQRQNIVICLIYRRQIKNAGIDAAGNPPQRRQYSKCCHRKCRQLRQIIHGGIHAAHTKAHCQNDSRHADSLYDVCRPFCGNRLID